VVIVKRGNAGTPLAISAKPSTSTTGRAIFAAGASRSAHSPEHCRANIFLTGVALTVGADNSGTEYDGVTIGMGSLSKAGAGLSPWLN